MYDVYGPQWWRSGRAFPSHAGDRGSISSRDRPKSLKRVVTAPLPNARGQVRVSASPFYSRYDTLMLMFNINNCSMAVSGEYRSNFEARPFIGKVDVSK